MQSTLPQRFVVVEVLRGLASLSVTLFHFCGQLSTDLPRAIAAVGWLGVDVFFVISGFVIPLSLNSSGYVVARFPHFILRRLTRLEPPYIASIVLVILLSYLSALAPGFQGSAPAFNVPQVASHLLYVIPLTSFGWLSPVYWSLAYEFVFYIIAGVSFAPLMGRSVAWMVALGIAMLLAKFAAFGSLDVRVLEFVLGALVFRYIAERERRNEALLWMAICCAGILGIGDAKAAITCAGVALAIIAFPHAQFGAWSLALGTISYSLYLTHVPVGGRLINIGKRFVDGPWGELALILSSLLVSLAFAALFARLVEVPALRMSRRLARIPPG